MADTQRLLADAQDGDPAAFDALLDPHRGRLAAYVRDYLSKVEVRT